MPPATGPAGPGPQRIVAGDGFRAFRVAAAGRLGLERVRISGRTVAGFGGDIRNEGALSLIQSRFDANRSGDDVPLGGGAIFNQTDATLVVERCTFDGNISPRGAAIFNAGTADIHNSGFVDDIDAGAVTEGEIRNRGRLTALHITVTRNGRAGVSGIGGFFAFDADTTPVNSIIAENLDTDCLVGNGPTTTIGRLSRNGNCIRQFGADPLLGNLDVNAGLTPTALPGCGSPVIDVADAALCLPADPRGLPRPQGRGCDLGAIEVEVVSAAIFGDGYEDDAPIASAR